MTLNIDLDGNKFYTSLLSCMYHKLKSKYKSIVNLYFRIYTIASDSIRD